jgi:nucleoside-diphosphate-sugar epimerase
MKVLVTGGTGFIGSYLIERLLHHGHDVISLVREGSNLSNLEGCKVSLTKGDIRNKGSLYPVVEGVDFIYHTAAIKFALNTEDYYKINHLGTKNLLEAVVETNHSLKGFVYISSLAAAGPSMDERPVTEEDKCHPITHYGKSKLLGEKEVLQWENRIPVVIVRPAATYGPRDRDIYLYFRWAKKGISARLGGGKQISLCYVTDLVKGILLAGEKGKKGGIYFLADEVVYSWDEIDDLVASILGRGLIKLKIPRFIIPLLGLMFDTWGRMKGRPLILNSEKLKEIRQPSWICDVSKAKEEIGFTVEHSLAQGIRETIAWYEDKNWL